MGLTNYEKQKRWREKNRALYNLQQRNRRKKISGVGSTGSGEAVEAECRQDQPKTCNTSPPSIPFETKKVGEFRMLVIPEQKVEKVFEVEVQKPRIFRDDFGNVISEGQWEKWQEKKRRAKEKGFTIDEYSQ